MKMIRKMRMLCFIVCGILIGSTTSFANLSTLAGQYVDGKYYIEPGTVHVAPSGIFLNCEGDFIPVEMVCVDEFGVYVLGYDCMRMVTCSRCGKSYNADRYSDRCPHTGQKVQY